MNVVTRRLLARTLPLLLAFFLLQGSGRVLPSPTLPLRRKRLPPTNSISIPLRRTS